MLYFMKPLPEGSIDTNGWKPFIRTPWFRNYYMYFTYLLQATLLITSIITGIWQSVDFYVIAVLTVFTYIVHELLHIAVICRSGDISITHSGFFLWITSGAVLGKLHFFLFMSLPFFMFTVFPVLLCNFLLGEWNQFFIMIAWINAIIAGSDIINSLLIIIKPPHSFFYRGYYYNQSDLL